MVYKIIQEKERTLTLVETVYEFQDKHFGRYHLKNGISHILLPIGY